MQKEVMKYLNEEQFSQQFIDSWNIHYLVVLTDSIILEWLKLNDILNNVCV